MIVLGRFNEPLEIDVTPAEIEHAEATGWSVVSAAGDESAWRITNPQGRKMIVYCSYMEAWQLVANELRGNIEVQS